jgi:hypothetical protein
MDEKRADVFAGHPELHDHRQDLPWLTGSIGDPFSPVWFIAEIPSLTRAKRGTGTSPNTQWGISTGDRLLRETLVECGLKTGDPMADGGWRCYLSDVIKSADVAKSWRQRVRKDKERVAEAWAPVMRYELEHGQPEFIVFLGDSARSLTTHLAARGFIPCLPPYDCVPHYSAVMSQPRGRLGPGHPARVAEWKDAVGQAVGSHLVTIDPGSPRDRRH